MSAKGASAADQDAADSSEPAGRGAPMEDHVTALIARIRSGDRRSLARAISDIEFDSAFSETLGAALGSRRQHTRRIGLTGPPGAGKSTLVAAVTEQLRRAGHRTAAVLVDPSSPRTGGAVLGDRIRLSGNRPDPDLYVRSLAARGHLGGTTRRTGTVISLLDEAGFDVILVETVGTGQSEVDVASMVDCTVVVTPPGSGDQIQAVKAGILEIADVLVVNKADLPEAAQMFATLRASHVGHDVPVLQTVARTGEGVEELVEVVLRMAAESRDAAVVARTPVLTGPVRSGLRTPNGGGAGGDEERLARALDSFLLNEAEHFPALRDLSGLLADGRITVVDAAASVLSLMQQEST